MRRLFFIMSAVVICAAAVSAGTVTYTADESGIFTNPERGFITMIGGHLTKKKPYGVKGNESTLDAHAANDKGSLVLVHYYLDNYKTTATLPSELLNAFDEDMQVLRSKGMKAIIRFSYVDGTYIKSGEESAADATLTIAKKHIDQYKSHWQANADVIFCFQAGFIGAWGEWYYTDNYGNQQSTINSSRSALVDALLAAVPQDRCIQLRTPLFKTGYIGSTDPLTATEAFAGTAKARLAHHNDAFLENDGDLGTYYDTALQKPYIAKETLYVPIGGESCILDEDVARTNASKTKTTAEMSRLHWTFIQSGYSEVVTNRWRNDGTFDELNRKMGYRYQLVKGTYSDEVAQGGQMAVNLQIRNAGYAPLYNARPAYIVLKNQNSVYSLQLASDPRRWLPNGVVTTVNEQLTIPASVPAGTYQLYLYMPDAYESLASDPRYAVRFANTNVWNASTGMNSLNASVKVVSSGGGDPQPPTPVGDAVLLPATLDQSNVSAYSEDMTWYNSDYFDFGPDDAPNLERWAEWNVELRYPGKYNVSEVMKSASVYDNESSTWNLIGHSWQLQLLNTSGAPVSSYTTQAVWAEGSLSYDTPWNLSSVSAGSYTLKVMNATEWAQPKLQSITLQYDGLLPTSVGATEDNLTDSPAYDLLGRPVGASYHGIEMRRGQKIIRY